MGIYAEYSRSEEHYVTNGKGWTEYRSLPGVKYSRNVIASHWVEVERTDCYCCSCDDDSGVSDGACRNHGFYAERPCETHNMPGSADDDGVMPASVQVARARLESSRKE